MSAGSAGVCFVAVLCSGVGGGRWQLYRCGAASRLTHWGCIAAWCNSRPVTFAANKPQGALICANSEIHPGTCIPRAFKGIVESTTHTATPMVLLSRFLASVLLLAVTVLPARFRSCAVVMFEHNVSD